MIGADMSTKQRGKSQALGIVMLLGTALIWGTAFVAQSLGIDVIGPFSFNAMRTLMGATVLLPVIIIKDAFFLKKASPAEVEAYKVANRKVIGYGIKLGVVFCVAQNLQQLAFLSSTAGKIAFITSLYMFFVPFIGLFVGKRIPLLTWISVFLAFAGLYFLSINPQDLTAINRGDVLTFICAIFFAFHILLIERFSPEVDPIKLSAMQFLTSGTISAVLMVLFENPTPEGIRSVIGPLLYSGVMSCGIAYTFQIIGQSRTEATAASLIMSLEAVFAVIAAWIILHERLTFREGLGCVIMFCAILLSQAGGLIQNRKGS